MNEINIHKSMGPDGIHSIVLKELVDVIEGPFYIIYQILESLGRSLLTIS